MSSGGDESTRNLIIAGAVAAATLVGGVVIWKLLSGGASGGNASETVTVKKPRQKRSTVNQDGALAQKEQQGFVLEDPSSTTTPNFDLDAWETYEGAKQRILFKYPKSMRPDTRLQHPVCMIRLVDLNQENPQDEEGVAIVIELLPENMSSKEYFDKSKQMLMMMNQMMMGSTAGFDVLEEKQTHLGDREAWELVYTQIAQNQATRQMMRIKTYNFMCVVGNRAYCVHYSGSLESYDPTLAKKIVSTITITDPPANTNYSILYREPKFNLLVPFPTWEYRTVLEDKDEIVTTLVHSQKESNRLLISHPTSNFPIEKIAADWIEQIKIANPKTPFEQENIQLANSTPAIKISYSDPTGRKGISVVFYMAESPFIATGFAEDDAQFAKVLNSIMSIRTESLQNHSRPFLKYLNTEHKFSLETLSTLRILESDFADTIVTFINEPNPDGEDTTFETAINIRDSNEAGESYDVNTMITSVLNEIDEMSQQGHNVQILEQKRTTLGALPAFHICVVSHLDLAMSNQEPIDMVYHITCTVRDGQLISVKSCSSEQTFPKVKQHLDGMVASFAFL